MRSYLLLLLVSIVLQTVSCQRRSLQPNAGKPGYTGYNSYGNTNFPEPTSPAKLHQSQPAAGIGAWGYVAIILTVLLSGLGIYYFVLFYPIVCKKERMYDVMEMTTV